MKSLEKHIKESFNQTNESIIDLVTTTNDKEVVETESPEKEEPVAE